MKRLGAAAIVLVIAIGIAFTPALRAKFTNWDDVEYVGTSRQPMRVLVTEVVTGHYHPLTMLSLGLDVRLFGFNPAGFHAMNVALHAATALLILLLLYQLTGSTTGALAGALFFAIHPLRVESVAWISERKDVLMGVFFAAALVTYLAHLRRGVSIGWTYLLFVLAILAKATAIVLPAGLLFIDIIERGRPRLLDKIPFAVISVAGAVEAILAIHSKGDHLSDFHLTAGQRVLVVARAMVLYVSREIVPVNLNAYYRYRPIDRADWLSFFAIVFLSIAVIASVRRAPRVVAALAFFVVTLAPMLPVMATSNAFATDRYTYIPSIGIAYLVAIGVAMLSMRGAIAVIAIGGVILGALTWNRCEVWHDGETLWRSVLDADPDVAIAWNNLGHARVSVGDHREGFFDFSRAIELDPCYTTALRNHGLELERSGMYELELRDADRILACHPDDLVGWSLRAHVLGLLGRNAEAATAQKRADQLKATMGIASR